jgi:hypothetical protein
MAFNRRNRKGVPVGENYGEEGTSQPRQMGGSRFAPRGSQRFGVNPGPMPTVGNSRLNNNMGQQGGSSRFAPRGSQRFGLGAGNNPAVGEEGGNLSPRRSQDPRFAYPQSNNSFQGNTKQQDPRFVTPQLNPAVGEEEGGFSPRRSQDPRFVTPQFNDFQGNAEQQDPRFVSGGRPVGLPNVNMRKPGSGGSRVMRRPTVGSMRNNRQNRLQSGRFPAGNSNSKKMGY